MTHERRTEEETRAMIERVADRAAEKAVQRFSELTPWDMTTKEGREQARATIAHANLLRTGCEAIKGAGWKTTTQGIAWVLILAFVFGFAWLFNVDLSRVFKYLTGVK